MEAFTSIKCRGGGPGPQNFFFNSKLVFSISIRPPISKSTGLFFVPNEMRFCPVLAASISEEQVCCEASVVIVIYYRKAKKPKVCKCACKREAKLERGHTQARSRAHFLFVFWEFCIHFLHHNLLSSVYRVRLLNNRCIRRWSTSTTVNAYE